MGSVSAFNYGRGFEMVKIALRLQRIPFTLVDPSVWTRVMHEGTPKDLRPKARSLRALEFHFAHLVDDIPRGKKGRIHDGAVDALLMVDSIVEVFRGTPRTGGLM